MEARCVSRVPQALPGGQRTISIPMQRRISFWGNTSAESSDMEMTVRSQDAVRRRAVISWVRIMWAVSQEAFQAMHMM